LVKPANSICQSNNYESVTEYFILGIDFT